MKSSEVRAKAHADGLVQSFKANSILHTEILLLLLIPPGEKKTISLSFLTKSEARLIKYCSEP